jgi:hypothetical protein
MSAITRLNRSGPIAFSQLTTGTPYGSINNLIDNVVGTPPTQNISLSSSLGLLMRNTGDPVTDTQNALGIGIGLVTLNDLADARMSEFYGGNFLSASIKQYGVNQGVWYTNFYPDSVVPNANFLTRETSSRVYRYAVYSKPTASPGSDFRLQYSYVRPNDSDEYITNLTSNNIYKIVLKDVVSNAFTSSIFTGTCASTSTTSPTTLFQSNNTTNFQTAIDSTKASINASSAISSLQRQDLNFVCNFLSTLINTPETYTLSGFSRIISTSWPSGGTRTFTVEGFIANVVNGGRYFAGYVSASGGTGTLPYSYAISDATTTTGNASLAISTISDPSASSCGSAPSITISNTSVTQRCGTPAQVTNNPTTPSQVRFSGSAIFTNPSTNAYNATYTLNADWINLANNQSLYAAPAGIAQLLPTFSPSTFTLAPGATQIVQYGFGLPYYNQSYQSSSFSAKASFTASFATTPSATLKRGEITATLDKSVCYVAAPPPSGGAGGCPAAWQLMETLERGFIPAREIQVGMHLRDIQDGLWNKVTVAYIAKAPIYRTTINGNDFDVDDSHQWYVGNDVWKVVTEVKKGDKLEGTEGEVLTVDDNILLFGEEEYMHLNCENQRFVMGTNVIGHNFPLKVPIVKN